VKRDYAEVIGDPISHSKSPLIHNFWLEKLGIDAEYRTCHVRPDALADYFARRREDAAWRGCNVTIPHKETVAPFVDEIDDQARAVGAINTVHKGQNNHLGGTNTDVDGAMAAFGSLNLVGKTVCVLGAGGAARAAFTVLAAMKCAAVLVLARNPEKAARVLASCGVPGAGVLLEAHSSALFGASLFVNATQLGMTGQDPMPAFILSELAELAKGALVFDMVYSPVQTELLKAAARYEFLTCDGLEMLIGQAATAFEKFFGHPAPRHYDADLRALLTQ
jgi:shikimate dehydrogenase